MVSFAKHGLSMAAYGAYKAAENEALRRLLFNSIRLSRIETERFRAIAQSVECDVSALDQMWVAVRAKPIEKAWPENLVSSCASIAESVRSNPTNGYDAAG
ncbi:hypothetical protein [Bradyrhizobium sp. 76]|uniref:hypothetical protein n=1 Tax=Bradyrhizobium sp. 76 TaxID=2782680 RepID=UPI001FF7B262|nr:hypothetical protein [Bradyrhizobium sp. 76]MCK1404959.1 hypothetical protein [Bradyrhizobium sp. 76]